MKTLNQCINEFLVKGHTNKKEYKYIPKSSDELDQIIQKRLKEEGNTCNLNDIDVSKISDFSYLFYNTYFNGDISQWDTSNATTFQGMFGYCDFNGDISSWDTSRVTNMADMFNSSKFNGDISRWDVSNVEDMDGMFCRASNFKQDLSSWKIKGFSTGMFTHCPLDKYKELQPQKIK